MATMLVRTIKQVVCSKAICLLSFWFGRQHKEPVVLSTLIPLSRNDAMAIFTTGKRQILSWIVFLSNFVWNALPWNFEFARLFFFLTFERKKRDLTIGLRCSLDYIGEAGGQSCHPSWTTLSTPLCSTVASLCSSFCARLLHRGCRKDFLQQVVPARSDKDCPVALNIQTAHTTAHKYKTLTILCTFVDGSFNLIHLFLLTLVIISYIILVCTITWNDPTLSAPSLSHPGLYKHQSTTTSAGLCL